MVSYLQIDGLNKRFGDLVLLEDMSLGISQGDKLGLIAPNGAGKTTLLNIIAGEEDYESGSVVFRNDLRVGYLEQSPSYPDDLTVLQACFHSQNDTLRLIEAYEKALSENDTTVLPDLLSQMDNEKAWDYERKAKQILSQLNIIDFTQQIKHLSGGQLKRVALANVLITEPDLLILDEPTNHLDMEMVEWLEEYLSRSTISLLMVTHDRYFLDRVCNSILEIDNRKVYKYTGNYSYYLEKREERLSAMNMEVDRASNLLRKELEWMRRQPKARGTKAKSRIDAFYDLEKKASQKQTQKQVSLNMQASYVGNKIFEAVNVSKSFDGKICIVEDFNYTFARYEKLGITGSNGTGKSTFIKMLLGEIEPDSGYFDVGETVSFGYYSQDGLLFDEQKKVIDIVQDIAEYVTLGDGNSLSVSQFLNHFLFPPEKQHSYVYKLSGGEKRRLYLCTVLMRSPNFLILDEPTNDLDIVTLNVLEDYLQAFKGCVIVISHDRYFMDKVIDHLWVFHGGGDIKDFPGNYSQYRLWKDVQKKEEVKEVKEVASKDTRIKNDNQGKRKLTFKEKREFESLEQVIADMEEEQSKLEQDLNSGTLSPDELMDKSTRISVLIHEIEEKTMRWIELSEWA